MKENSEVREKIKEYWDVYRVSTTVLSSILRGLAFTEAGAIWILMIQEKNHSCILILSFLMLILFFIADAFQYHFAADDYRAWARKCEKMLDKNPNISLSEINKPKEINNKSQYSFYIKIFFIFLTSMFLVIFLLTHI